MKKKYVQYIFFTTVSVFKTVYLLMTSFNYFNLIAHEYLLRLNVTELSEILVIEILY